MNYTIKNHENKLQTANIIVPWWQISHTVLTACVFRLVEQGQLKLEATYLDLNITLEHLLAKGLDLSTYQPYQDKVNGSEEPLSLAAMIESLKASDVLYLNNQTIKYEQIAFAYVRQVIEKTTGLSLQKAIEELIFSKLGIKDVTVNNERVDLKYCASIKKGYHPAWYYPGLLTGSIKSLCEFMDQLSQAHIVSSDHLEHMRALSVKGTKDQKTQWKNPTFGLGLTIEDQEGEGYCYGQSGVGPGSVIGVYHFPNLKVPMTIAVSKGGLDLEAVESEIFKTAMYNR